MRLATLAVSTMLVPACAVVGTPGSVPTPSSVDTGCSTMVTVSGDLTVASAADFDGLPTGCWTLGGQLTVFGPGVTSVAQLGDLRSVGSLEIRYTNLTAFDVATAIDVTGQIDIDHNPTLADLSGVAPAGTVSSLVIENDDALTGLGGLSHLTAIAGATRIDNDAALATVDLSAVTRLDGQVAIHDNTVLSRITLPALASVSDLAIYNNQALNALDSLSKLQEIHGSLMLGNNSALSGLGTLGSSLAIDQNLVIIGNADLSELGQLSHAGRIGGSVEISGNSHLDYCAAAAIGCCVDAASVAIWNNMSSSCDGATPWCWTEQNGCPYGN